MSSNDIVIRVDNVSKCFNVYTKPQDRLKQLILPKVQRLIGKEQSSYSHDFWALQQVSFEIGRGHAVGILGQNGSGKSTLLQIITGTMTPTSGTVETFGRVAALLELGSGFNPDFTGRENVYLNGSLIGLSREQVDAKFDMIAAFADIGEHLEQPVKTYSSGMMLRLAFAVQVAVESEILIIDEALAVGDARFQLKCFRRLEELKENGTTILFVSHATELVRSFCDYGLVLNYGKPVYWGDAKTATVKYMEVLFPDKNQLSDGAAEAEAQAETVSEDLHTPLASESVAAFREEDTDKAKRIQTNDFLLLENPPVKDDTFGIGGAKLKQLKIFGLDKPNILVGARTLTVQCEYTWDVAFLKDLIERDRYEKDITLGISIANNKGNYIFGCNGFDSDLVVDCFASNTCSVEFSFKMPYLTEGDYFLTVAIAVGTLKYHIQLRWYDCLVQLKMLKDERNVFGAFAIDYQMNLVNAMHLETEKV